VCQLCVVIKDAVSCWDYTASVVNVSNGAVVMGGGGGDRSSGAKPVPASLCPTQVSQILASDQTRASAGESGD
jgi:hypothetical protein